VPLSCNLGTLTSWNPLGHSRPVTGLLYLYLYIKEDLRCSEVSKPVFGGYVCFTDFDVFMLLSVSRSLSGMLVSEKNELESMCKKVVIL
jgi:hypothetical protein